MTTAEKYADKIAKLLAKAQSTTPEEAEQLIAKAQELMTRYAIDQAMIDSVRSVGSREEIIETLVTYEGTFRMATWRLAAVVAQANRCRTILSDDTRRRIATLHVVGFESDVERARMLDASLQIQMQRALNSWWESDATNALLDRNRKFAARRQFMFSFTSAVDQRLTKATKVATDSAMSKSPGVALVLRSRKDSVNDWVDEQYGGSLRNVKSNYKAGAASAHRAGHEAGSSADVGNPRVGKTPEIGR